MKLAFQQNLLIEQVKALEESQLIPQVTEECQKSDIDAKSLPEKLYQYATKQTSRLIDSPETANLLKQPGFIRHQITIIGFLGFIIGVISVTRIFDSSTSQLNIFWLLMTLLGSHFIALLFWLSTLFWSQKHDKPAFSIPAWITETTQYIQKRWLSPPPSSIHFQFHSTAWRIKHQGNIGRWQMGVYSHLFWTTFLASSLATLLLIFSTQQFHFYWGSTLMNSSAFTSIIHTLSLPFSHLIHATPSAEQIQQSQLLNHTTLNHTHQRVWAFFILYSVIIYGMSIRLIGLIFCLWKCHQAKQAYSLDYAQSYYLLKEQALMPKTDLTQVIDNDEYPPEAKKHPIDHTSAPSSPSQFIGLFIESPITPIKSLEHRIQKQVALTTKHDLETYLGTQHDTNQAIILLLPNHKVPDRGIRRLITKILNHHAHSNTWIGIMEPTDNVVTQDKLHQWKKFAHDFSIPTTQVLPVSMKTPTGHTPHAN